MQHDLIKWEKEKKRNTIESDNKLKWIWLNIIQVQKWI